MIFHDPSTTPTITLNAIPLRLPCPKSGGRDPPTPRIDTPAHFVTHLAAS